MKARGGIFWFWTLPRPDWSDGEWLFYMEVIRGSMRHHAFSRHQLVLWLDHGRPWQSVPSLARAGFQAVQLLSEHSHISYRNWGSWGSECGCGLSGFNGPCLYPGAERSTDKGGETVEVWEGVHQIVLPCISSYVASLHPLLSTQLVSLLARRLLLSSSGPDSFSTHSRLLRTLEPRWIVLWRIMMCFHILSLWAFWWESGRSITLCSMAHPNICIYLDVFITLWRIWM